MGLPTLACAFSGPVFDRVVVHPCVHGGVSGFEGGGDRPVNRLGPPARHGRRRYARPDWTGQGGESILLRPAGLKA